jgi:hypothetical protein
MKRVIIVALLFTLLMSVQVFAQHFDLPEPVYVESFVYLPAAAVIDQPDFADLAYLWAFNPAGTAEEIDFTSVATFAAAATSDAIIPGSIRNNEYFLESVRLKGLADSSYEEGDYDASSRYAAESLRYAQLSDEYVALQLKIREANNLIARAEEGGVWVLERGLDKVYPNEWAQGQSLYSDAVNARSAEDWDRAIDSARRALTLLDGAQDFLPLPAQYMVRTWQGEKDCLWNIAGYKWVYGDSRQWRRLYDANKSKFPDPNNPNVIEPGMILDIPSINNETRQGIWKQGLSYPDY